MDNGTFNLSRGQTPLTDGSEGKTLWRLLLFDSFFFSVFVCESMTRLSTVKKREKKIWFKTQQNLKNMHFEFTLVSFGIEKPL